MKVTVRMHVVPGARKEQSPVQHGADLPSPSGLPSWRPSQETPLFLLLHHPLQGSPPPGTPTAPLCLIVSHLDISRTSEPVSGFRPPAHCRGATRMHVPKHFQPCWVSLQGSLLPTEILPAQMLNQPFYDLPEFASFFFFFLPDQAPSVPGRQSHLRVRTTSDAAQVCVRKLQWRRHHRRPSCHIHHILLPLSVYVFLPEAGAVSIVPRSLVMPDESLAPAAQQVFTEGIIKPPTHLLLSNRFHFHL